jgi:transcriptional regulator with PAS, ATPase and Fis domain
METQKQLMDAIARSAPLYEVQRLYTFHVLEKEGGNKVHAAERLGIDRRTIQRWEKRPPVPRNTRRV